MAEEDFASASLTRHLARGAAGFGALAGAVALPPVAGPAALLLAPVALVALRGCPTCWFVGLLQTISRGRLERSCRDGRCEVRRARP
ncbi:hypothetical protein [Actinomadura roseirufa]|uniref:hypothetical protein n=1 Tax=Actinomadura roseirufa TaxID=2094049 RepID=UPI00104189AA|nr:hypothetical protein [Actinomadura roseirufa]